MRLNPLLALFSACILGFGSAASAAEVPTCEARAAWIGSPRGMNWDSTMAALEAAGFNMVFPCMQSAGQALYPSTVLPMRSQRDELALCLEAAHKHGIEVHVWRIDWFTTGATKAHRDSLRAAGRVQVSSAGKSVSQVMDEQGWGKMEDWLCPSQAANRKLEHDAMLELAERYPVDGVHFDYMRYADESLCYCDSCKANFAAETGMQEQMSGWPADFAKGGKYHEIYQNWRRKLIHSLAREIALDIHRRDPYVCVSLAARPSIDWASLSDAQQWWKWVDEGILDFICPMDYDTKPENFVKAITPQLDLIRGVAPFYTGLGMYEFKGFEDLQTMVRLGRERGQDGFVAFEIESLLKVLDQAGKSLTQGKAIFPHRAPETRFHLAEPSRRTAEGFPVYSPGQNIDFETVVMLRAKLREGVSRVSGDLLLEKVTGEALSTLGSLDLDRAVVHKAGLTAPAPGRYRLALAGQMTLSTGEKKPFVARSFPFQVE
ncbi:family 10 glycosylhydrolase [bacterium]|nr:family 10 glycosylhydrolase [bacterium]